MLVLVAASALAGFARSAAFSAGGLPLHALNAAVVIGLNAVCLRLVGRTRDLRPLVLFQLAIDALNFTFTVYKTGGVASPLNSSRRIGDVADAILGELLDFLRLAPRISIPLREGAGLTARVAIRRTAMNVRRPQDSPFINRDLQKRIGTNPFAIAPLVVGGKLIGVLGVDRSVVSGEIGDEEFQVLKIFAGQAAIAINGLRK